MSLVYDIPKSLAHSARVTAESYKTDYARSISDPDSYWGDIGQRLDWIRPFTRVKDTSFNENDFRIRWYEDGTLNVSANCLDRHLATRADQIAILWEGDDASEIRRITYAELHRDVCRFSNALKSVGAKRGDRITLYMPMIPEAAIAMLACARIGAIHSIVFGGFSPQSLANRIVDCGSKIVVTADEGNRGGRKVPLKANVDAALSDPTVTTVETVIVVKRTGAEVAWQAGRDVHYDTLLAKASADCPAEEMNAEDPLFILYTSGSTGKPKGVLHTTAGYLVHASHSFETVFDHRSQDIFWCTADVGWVTGHSYVVYGPLAAGATTFMFEGVPNYPNPGRCWDIVDRHGITVFHTAPTAIRALMAEGDQWVTRYSRASLRLLGSVGEPINPEAWEWYHGVVGDRRCPIVDTWWQTETGGILLTPFPGATPLKPGAASMPFFGTRLAIVDGAGQELSGACEGSLVVLDSWPGQMRTVYGDQQRFIDTYFKTFPGTYFTGDGARRDEDGYYWITGRVDDVLNISGHRMGTAEVESALVSHPSVAEAAVVGYAHAVKGQGIYAFVTLKLGIEPTPALVDELKKTVRAEIGAIATPDIIQWAPGLPKTRSGKIMRRILRKIAANEGDSLGDTSTLADPSVVQQLLAGHAALG